jgi:hypothetical protein
LAPVTFDIGGRRVQPFSVSPWAEDALDPDLPALLQVLRGDFFCMPFGSNDEPFNGEAHPPHGETANRSWTVEAHSPTELRMSLQMEARTGRVEKTVRLEEGHPAVYCRHVISGMTGPMSFGHHATLKFSSTGLISTSPFGFGQVFPGEFEQPPRGGYSSLKPGARFESLESVPLANGGTADLTRYPAREGFEDLALVFSDLGRDFAWTAVTFPDEGYVWFSLKDPRVLTGTMLWHSNGGRHYKPWNGRHRNVLGLEELTSYFHTGLIDSVADNDAQRAGYTTYVELDPERPVVVNTILGVVPAPADFGRVAQITPTEDGVSVTSEAGHTLAVPLDPGFLYA